MHVYLTVVSDSPLLYPEYPKLSLVQMYDMVTASVDNLIRHCTVSTHAQMYYMSIV